MRSRGSKELDGQRLCRGAQGLDGIDVDEPALIEELLYPLVGVLPSEAGGIKEYIGHNLGVDLGDVRGDHENQVLAPRSELVLKHFQRRDALRHLSHPFRFAMVEGWKMGALNEMTMMTLHHRPVIESGDLTEKT